jgi:hypothetical protein
MVRTLCQLAALMVIGSAGIAAYVGMCWLLTAAWHAI